MGSSINATDQETSSIDDEKRQRLRDECKMYNEAIEKARISWLESKSVADHHDWALQCAVFLGSDALAYTGDHWYCGTQSMFEKATRALFLFSFEIGEEDRGYPWFQKFKLAHAKMLSECRECAVKYQTVCHLDLAEFYCDQFGSEKAQEAMQIIYRYDRQRILSQLELNPESTPVMTEALWSNACLSSARFIEKHFRTAPALQSTKADLVAQYGVCPGFLMFFFLLKDTKLRHIGGRNLLKTNASIVCDAWKSAPAIFKNVLNTALKRHSHAGKLADLAWYHCYLILKAYHNDTQVANDIIKLVVKEMGHATGLPRYGAHTLIMQALKVRHVNPEIDFSNADLDKLIDYAMAFNDPETHKDLPEDVNRETISQSFLDLDAQVIVEWFRYYLECGGDPTLIRKRLQYMLSFSENAFNSISGYEKASLVALKAAAMFPESIFSNVLDDCASRLVKVSTRFNAEYVSKLWRYQLEHENKWALFWNLWAKDPELGSNLLSSPDNISVILRLLQGCRDLGLRWPAPKRSTPKGDNKKPTPSSNEEFIRQLLESLNDYGNTDQFAEILRDKRCLYTILILTASGNRSLSMCAEEFINIAFNEDSFENSINNLINNHPETALSVLNSILVDVSSVETKWLAAIPGIIKLASMSLDEIYDVNDGIDTVNNPKILHYLQLFWSKSWEMISNAIKQFRTWAQVYSVSHLKLVISHCMDFSNALLNKFRLLEGDLGNSLPGAKNWGTELSSPVISCFNNMSELLRLKDPEYVSSVFQVLMDILGLMNSFKVQVPPSLLSFVEQLANRKLSSMLDTKQLKVLLGALGLSESEIYNVVELKKSGVLYRPQPNSAAVNHSQDSAQIGNSRVSGNASMASRMSRTESVQKNISDFFGPSNGSKFVVPSRTVINNQVVPISGQQTSAMSQLRAQFAVQKTSGFGSSTNRVTQSHSMGNIHPERPPGFNRLKPQVESSTAGSHNNQLQNSDGSDDNDEDEDEDEEGLLGALGTKTKAQEEKLAKLRMAYEASKSSKVTLTPILSESVAAKTRTFTSVEEQKEREKRAMKARLQAQPTELHRVILSWEYFDSRPPLSHKGPVPEKFESVKQYQDIMSPLLYLEAWESLQKFKEEAEKYDPKIFQLVFGKRLNVDGFTDVYVSIAKDAFATAGLGEGDLLLLSYDKSCPGKLMEPNRALPHFLARIKEGSIESAKNPKKQHVDFQIRLNCASSVLAPLNLGEIVCGKSAGNLRTAEREFTALMALPHYNLVDDILEARLSFMSDDAGEIVRYQKNLGLNKSQSKAVVRAISNTGFSLIQGPPGTGKTKTILGIVGAFFTNNQMKSDVTGSALAFDKKVLICAPSNAAVDEIVLRLKSGVTDGNGRLQKPGIVRLGRMEMVSEQVRDVTLDSLISKAIGQAADITDSQLRQEHSQLTARRNEVRKSLQVERGKESISEESVSQILSLLGSLNDQIRQKSSELKEQGERLGQARKQRDLMYREQQNDILQKTQIICTTLSASAHPILASLGITFEIVIIDEAAQCVELSALIPLKYGSKKCIMVGDPNQLPPTVISQEAGRLKYEQSLFVRMYNQYKAVPGAVIMLNTQFRMHTEISKFPSAEFYSGKLLDGENLNPQLERPWHSAYKALGPYTFFAVRGKQERYNGHSLRNVAEANAALALVTFVLDNFSDIGSIGVITPYKEQVRLLRQIFVQSLGAKITSTVDFNSIDGFQGQEKDLVIMSCVRATDSAENSIGFVGDIRRINVALTRAKTSMWILGNPESLKSNPVWSRLINDAAQRNRLVKCYSGDIIDSIEAFNKVDGRSSRIHHLPESTPASTESLKRAPDHSQLRKDSKSNKRIALNDSNGSNSTASSSTLSTKSTLPLVHDSGKESASLAETNEPDHERLKPTLKPQTLEDKPLSSDDSGIEITESRPSRDSKSGLGPSEHQQTSKKPPARKRPPNIFIKRKPKRH